MATHAAGISFGGAASAAIPRLLERLSAATLGPVLVAATLAASAPLPADEPAELTPSSPRISIRDGVFTEAQAKRGQVAYTGPCNRCHGGKLDGAQDEPDMLPSPPVAGAKFLRRWEGQSLAALFEYTRATMPANNPGFLTPQEFVDIIAYMLAASGAPAGETELTRDARTLAQIVVSSVIPPSTSPPDRP